MGNFPMYDDEGTTTIQSQPNSREAEEAVLGSVLINPDSYFEISQVINPEDFYIIRNQWIWRSFMRLHDRKMPIDILTVSEDLQEQGQLGEVGGQAYLLSLVNQTPTSLHAQAYAQNCGAKPRSGGVCWPLPTRWQSWLTTRGKRSAPLLRRSKIRVRP